jgi:hypothetical protein
MAYELDKAGHVAALGKRSGVDDWDAPLGGISWCEGL